MCLSMSELSNLLLVVWMHFDLDPFLLQLMGSHGLERDAYVTHHVVRTFFPP